MKSIPAKVTQITGIVAPHWGAWIEIIISGEHLDTVEAHPTGVRGLK